MGAEYCDVAKGEQMSSRAPKHPEGAKTIFLFPFSLHFGKQEGSRNQLLYSGAENF